jgi:integrase
MEHQTLLYDHDYKKLPEIFSDSQISQILDALASTKSWNNQYGQWITKRNKAIYMLMYHTAARPKEICSLKKEDVDFNSKVIKISGKNNKVRRDRKVPLPSQALPYLYDYFNMPLYLWKGSQYLFPSMENDHISPERWKMIFRGALKKAKIWKPAVNSTHPPFRSYTLRHTKLSKIMSKTNNIFDVANIAGHSKIDSSKVYIHTSTTYMDHLRSVISSS